MQDQLSRRSLLAGLAAVSALRGAAPGGRMRFGFTTYEWGRDWDIPTLIANCTRAGALGVELRTSLKYAHGVELELPDAERREVKKRFAGSPVTLVGIASGERFDSPDPAKLSAAIENAKGYIKLSHDVGGSGVRVFPNDFHKDVPQEKTIEQIGRALGAVGRFAADYGQMVRVENHGTAGRLPAMRKMMDIAGQKNVRIKLNSDIRDAENGKFEENFRLVKDYLGDTLHMHDLDSSDFPYQLQMNLLAAAGWKGWWLLEQSTKVPDRVQGMIQQRELWEQLLAKSGAAR